MKKFKVLSMILAVAMLASMLTVGVSAEKQTGIIYEVDEDFADYTVGGVNGAWTENNAGASLTAVDEAIKTSIKGDGITLKLSEPLAKDEIISIKYKVKASHSGMPHAVYFTNSATSRSGGWQMQNDRLATYSSGVQANTNYEAASGFAANTWREIEYIVDTRYDRFTTYVAGTVPARAKDKVIRYSNGENYVFEGADSITFQVGPEAWNNAFTGDIYFDDIKIERKQIEYSESIEYFEDFSGYNSLAGADWRQQNIIPDGFIHMQWPDQVSVTSKERTDNPETLMFVGWPSGQKIATIGLNKPVYDGKVTFEFDMKGTSTAAIFPDLVGATAYKNRGGDVGNDSDRYAVCNLNNSSPALGEWLKIKIVINMDTGALETYINDAITTKVYHTTVPSTIRNTGLWALGLRSGGSTNDHTYIDNIKITHETAAAELINFSDDFNDYSAASELATKSWVYKVASTASSAAIKTKLDDDTDKYISLNSTNGDDLGLLEGSLGGSLTRGKFKISYDVMDASQSGTTDTGATQWGRIVVMLTDSAWGGANNTGVAFTMQQGGYAVGRWAKDDGTYDFNTWYHVDMVADLTAEPETITVTMTDKATGEKIIENVKKAIVAVDGNKPLDTVNYIRLQINGTDDEIALDNFSWEEVCEEPVVNSVKFIDMDGNESTDTTAVKPGTKTIAVDTATSLLPSSVTEDTFYLYNITDDEKVAVDGKMVGTEYHMNLDNYLKPKKDYKIVMTDGVKNLNNESSGEEEITVSFSTTDGIMQGTINGVTINGEEITDVAQLKQGGVLRTKFDFFNSTGVAADTHLIYTYYKDDVLVYTFYDSFPIGADMFEMYYSIPREMEGIDADSVKVFMWDGIKNMVPLTDHFFFGAE